ncbi:MAG: arginase family protein, partial [Chloroflexales bacterium]|nr:arginase family protein [Chloroflexales bacterium]
GCAKLAGALRDQQLLARLGAADAGVVTPPRYVPDWAPGWGVRNGSALAGYTSRLADRIGRLLDQGAFPVVLGGDCSILLGAALALRRRGRYGLAFLDGHSDFRHLGNAPAVGAAAGEDLALVTGRGHDDLVNIDGLRPYVADADIAVLGIRDDDEYAAELAAFDIHTAAATTCRTGPATAAASALARLTRHGLAGYWVHLDVDVLDPTVMPAVDSPDPGGLDWPDLRGLLGPLLAHPGAVGLQITVFDPDLDPDGRLATTLADLLVDVVHRR